MVQDIAIDAFDYELPGSRIAGFPLPKRDESKLLIYNEGRISESVFCRIADRIPASSLLVFNNTRVIQARLIFEKETGAEVEIFCLEPKEPSDYALSLSQHCGCVWLCLVGNSRRWKSGRLVCARPEGACRAERLASEGDLHWIRFEWDCPDWRFSDVLELFGELPIPPYLNRKTEKSDKTSYQTVYSRVEGSVAAPTAGLHFTQGVLDALDAKQVFREELTLHVGAGTFRPVKSARLLDHTMHAECFSVEASTVRRLLACLGRVYAVGTTSVRALESLYYVGLMLERDPDAERLVVDQWTPYAAQDLLPASRALGNVLGYLQRRGLSTLRTYTQILIAPGYDFKVVDAMITNFHQPRSTLLLLVSAFTGGDWRRIYDYALGHDFRFLSYGDSSLLVRRGAERG
jgi:S-adenosylmethionine:tRNA ribosyltransferase-isomerase